MHLSPSDFDAIDRELCKRSLAEFAKQAWHILEPATPLKWGWALDAICQHLEAVTEGDIKRLLMNVPPGSMKSLLTGVIWPAWEWGPRGFKHHRYLATAHSQSLAVRDNMKCRRLVASEWYQSKWPTPLTTDQNAKTKFENSATGFREAMAFTSMTGSRGSRVLLDDPISADNANSDAELESAHITFTETLPTRINDDQSAIVVIMQRLNERDTSGVILDLGLGYTHLMIPMRFEPERACRTSIGWEDPRTDDGELMFPERFSEEQVASLEKTMGSYASAGQLQQRPAPRGGGMFKRAWFQPIPAAPVGTKWIRGWDLAATAKKDAARTASVRMGRTPDGRIVIGHVTKDQLGPMEVERLILNTAKQDAEDGGGTISIPQDPGQAGKVQKSALARLLAGYDVRFSPESGSKEDRARPLSAQAEAGNVLIVSGAWNREFLDEAETFPNGKFKDQIDAASRAFGELVKPRSVAKTGRYGTRR